mgnify:CR=1 FL=1
MKKICVITGTRADYGLLRPLIERIERRVDLKLQLIATAMHLSPEFGMTINEIGADGFKVDKKIDCLLSSDSSVGISKSIGLAQISIAEALDELKPDSVVILGDRTEMLAAATAALIANIPIAHIHGGETTEGAYDEAIRHAITKMSYWHFTSTEVYRKRVIQLGEAPDRVYNVGAIGLDSIKQIKLLDKTDFEKSIDFKLNNPTALVTYHPVTLEDKSAEEQFKNILKALESRHDLNIIFTHANSDKGGRIINKMIFDYVSKNPDKSVHFKSLGQLRYLSALKHVNLVIGNSSSGIIEVPYFSIPTVNIGDRQKGRVHPLSVMNCNNDVIAIQEAIHLALSDKMKDKIKTQKQLYGMGKASHNIIEILSKENSIQLKKKFYDLN